MREVYEAVERLLAAGGAGCVATVVSVSGSTPQRVGAKLLVRADGTLAGTVGGGAVEAEVVATARALCAGQAAPRTERYDLTAALGMCCGGSMEVFFEPVRAAERLLVFGAGHVGQALAAAAALVHFRVVVVDAREEWAASERFPGAELVRTPWPDALEALRPGPGDYAIVTTHAHEIDQDILLALARRDLSYLGMIGSKRKVVRALQRLEREGVAREQRERVWAPIGFDVGAVTPAEIAASVVVELVRVRRRPELAARRVPVAHLRFDPAGH